ncbi:MAG: hypothetical protein AB7F86_09475 [Bdellovibrionales bacterium]
MQILNKFAIGLVILVSAATAKADFCQVYASRTYCYTSQTNAQGNVDIVDDLGNVYCTSDPAYGGYYNCLAGLGTVVARDVLRKVLFTSQGSCIERFLNGALYSQACFGFLIPTPAQQQEIRQAQAAAAAAAEQARLQALNAELARQAEQRRLQAERARYDAWLSTLGYNPFHRR